jgi:hypothetical protein
MRELSEILFPTIFYILPIAGATYTIGKIFHRQIIAFIGMKENSSKSFYVFAKLTGTFILLIWGCLLCFFLIVAFWFPSIEIPKSLKIAGLILLIPYIICTGALYGLSRAVAGGAGSVTGVLKGLTDMVSKEQSNKKK